MIYSYILYGLSLLPYIIIIVLVILIVYTRYKLKKESIVEQKSSHGEEDEKNAIYDLRKAIDLLLRCRRTMEKIAEEWDLGQMDWQINKRHIRIEWCKIYSAEIDQYLSYTVMDNDEEKKRKGQIEFIISEDFESLRSIIESSLITSKEMKYGDYNTAGLILSNLKLHLENKH